MKRFILAIALTITCLLGFSQVVTHTNWTKENSGEWGEFYWKVNRSSYTDSYGKYWYYMYFYSNALFKTRTNGKYDKASCYVKGVNMIIQERRYKNGPIMNTGSIYSNYIICDYHYDTKYYVAYFYSTSPYCTFDVTFQSATPYDYSLYYTR